MAFILGDEKREPNLIAKLVAFDKGLWLDLKPESGDGPSQIALEIHHDGTVKAIPMYGAVPAALGLIDGDRLKVVYA